MLIITQCSMCPSVTTKTFGRRHQRCFSYSVASFSINVEFKHQSNAVVLFFSVQRNIFLPVIVCILMTISFFINHTWFYYILDICQSVICLTSLGFMLSVYLYECLSTSLLLYLPACPYILLLLICLSVCLSVCFAICLVNCVPFTQSVCLCICYFLISCFLSDSVVLYLCFLCFTFFYHNSFIFSVCLHTRSLGSYFILSAFYLKQTNPYLCV